MSEALSQLSAFSVFLAIAGFGFLLLLLSLLFGEFVEHLGDLHLEHGGPGFFSVRILSVFITAFGGFGAIAAHYGVSPLAASGVGFGSGAIFAYPVYAFARFLYRQQASSELQTSDLVGQTGRVVVAIPAGGVGQVRCQIGEALVDKVARSKDGAALAENAAVHIERVLGETVVVRPE